MKSEDWALVALFIIGLVVVAWVLDALGKSPHLSTISFLVFIGVIVYYLFLKSPVKAALLRRNFGQFIEIILADSDNYILTEKKDRITFSKRSQPNKQMLIWSYNNGNCLVMRVLVLHDKTVVLQEDFDNGTDAYLIASSVSSVF